MSLLLRKISSNNIKQILYRQNDTQVLVISCRKLSVVPSLYDGDRDPAPVFFSPNVQILLKRLTRPDFAKVFRKRTNKDLPVLRTPTYKFLTNEELEDEIIKANRQANKLLQMPPAVKIEDAAVPTIPPLTLPPSEKRPSCASELPSRLVFIIITEGHYQRDGFIHYKVLQPIIDVLSKDPALLGYDTAKYVFTDISFGVANEQRIIVERDPDGSLRSCDHDIRKRLNQVYFPIHGRKIKEPAMFTDQEKLDNLLEREQYEFILDRACLQYEPDEQAYQRITSVTYQHIDKTAHFDMLRSTRHFGPMTFYLTWHENIDNLMLELIQSGAVRDAVLLTALRQEIHGDVANGDVAQGLTQQILPTAVQLTKPDRLSEEDIQLDTKCMECVEKYIVSNSAMKSQQELALQGFREYYQQLIDLSRGLQKAHGNV